MGEVTGFIQSSISKKEKGMKFAYGLVLGLLTFTQAYTLGGDIRKREANTQYLESYTPEKLEDPVYSLKRKREAKEGEREDGKLQKYAAKLRTYAEKLEAAAAKLEDSVYSLKRKREAKEEDKYYYGEGETTTEGEDGKLVDSYSLKRKREAKEEDKYYYGEGETTTEAEEGKLVKP